jgi:hypothetical protein
LAGASVKVLRPMLVWFLIVGLFSAYGYLYWGQPHATDGPWPTSARIEMALAGILSWGGLGVGVGTCAVSAWILLARVNSRRLERGWAILIFAAVCALSVPLPLLVALLSTALPEGIRPFEGSGGFLLVFPYFMFWISVAAFAVFVPCAVLFPSFKGP